MTKKRITICLLLVGAIVLGWVLYGTLLKKQTNPRTAGLVKVEGYHYVEQGQVTCAAVTPACGACFGEVINKQCYVDKAKLTPEELKEMGF